jgi:hypothetical protein
VRKASEPLEVGAAAELNTIKDEYDLFISFFSRKRWETYADVTSTTVADSGVEFGRGFEATNPRARRAEMAVDMYIILIVLGKRYSKERMR